MRKHSKYEGKELNGFYIKGCFPKITFNGSRYTCFLTKCCNCGVEREISQSAVLRKKAKCDCISERHKRGGFDEKSRLYNIYMGIIKRTTKPYCKDYPNYGARGIKMCDEWLNDYGSFYTWAMNNGYDDHLSIDRMDNNGNYEPSNCRWVTAKEQANNTRKNRVIEYDGVKMTLKQWSEKVGIDRTTIATRLNRGWDVERALYTQTR